MTAIPLLALIGSQALPFTPSRGQDSTHSTAIVAYLDMRGALPRLPREFTFPTTVEDVRSVFSAEEYVVREPRKSVVLVIDRRIKWAKRRVDALVLLREFATRAEPFEAVQIGDLSEDAREAAISFVNMVQPRPLRSLPDDELPEAKVAIKVASLLTDAESGKWYAPVLGLQEEKGGSSTSEELISSPIGQRTPKEGEMAAILGVTDDVVVRRYGGRFDSQSRDLVTAAEEFALFLEDVKREGEEKLASLAPAIERVYGQYLGSLRLGSTARIGAGSTGIRQDLEASFLANWQINGFDSRDEAHSHWNRDRAWNLKPIIYLRWCNGRSSTGQASFIEIEIYRGT